MKVRLQFGVAVAFTLITVTMIGIVVAFLYVSNRDLALQTARAGMLEAQNRSVSDIVETLSQTASVVEATAAIVGEFPEMANTLGTLDVLNRLVEGHEQYYGVYFGRAENGSFYQNVVLPHDADTFGKENFEVPDGVTRVLRVIDGPETARIQRYYWVAEIGPPVQFDQGPVEFDPRERPWYVGAIDSDTLFVTELYLFESTGEPGVTFAKRITDAQGNIIGVAGADITMSALASILENIRIGDHGLTFIINEDGQLTAYTGTRASGDKARFLTSNPDGELVAADPVIAKAMELIATQNTPSFRFALDDTQEKYIGSATQIPEMFGLRPTLGLVVPENEFVGSIKRTTARVLAISALVLVFAILVTIIVARLLSKNLNRVADDARRITEFDLADSAELRSSIFEVSELNDAMSNMKAGLKSFGAYVPKDLVRAIVAKGEEVAVGGVSRDVTIMFSDLQSFTKNTEHLAPEALMPALSGYFATMEKQITAHGGTVDKYIGDAIMALWNAPLLDDKHCENACRAVLACMRAEAEINAHQTSSPLVPLHTRFGLHRDTVVVGNVGSLSRMQYTALGAAVNLASRVEGLGKVYGSKALVTEPIVNRTNGLFCFREVDLVSPAGTSKPVRIFELIGEAAADGLNAVSGETRQEIEDWNACHELYRSRQWQEALEAFQNHMQQTSNVKLVGLYIRRCETFINAPPDDSWTGVFELETK